MRAQLKVRLNGKEISIRGKAEKVREAVYREEGMEKKGERSDIRFVKGLATGESIHWVLIE